MSYRLVKAQGARVPDLVSHLAPSAAFIATPALVVSGKLVYILNGLVTLATTATKVAGIISSEYVGAAATFTSRGVTVTRTFPNGVVSTDVLPFLPVHGQLLIEADITASTIALADGLPGDTLDIDTTGLLLTTSSNADFFITKVIEAGDTYVTKVQGFFMSPGYFTS